MTHQRKKSSEKCGSDVTPEVKVLSQSEAQDFDDCKRYDLGLEAKCEDMTQLEHLVKSALFRGDYSVYELTHKHSQLMRQIGAVLKGNAKVMHPNFVYYANAWEEDLNETNKTVKATFSYLPEDISKTPVQVFMNPWASKEEVLRILEEIKRAVDLDWPQPDFERTAQFFLIGHEEFPF